MKMAERTRPIIASMAGLVAGFAVAAIAAPRLDAELWTPERMPLVSAVCSGIGALAGSLFGSMFSLRLGAYWFWFLAALGGIGFAPLTFNGESETFEALWSGWGRLETRAVLLHLLAATVAAGLATVGQHLVVGVRTANERGSRYGLGELATGGVVLAVFALALHWLGAAPLLLVAAVSPLAGKQATLLALRFLDKRRPQSAPDDASSAPAPSRRQRWRTPSRT